MASLIIRASAIWLFLVVLAIINGTIREKLLVALLGGGWALPASGILLSAMIFLSTLAMFRFLSVTSSNQAWFVGGFWLLLTVAFEFLFGHFVAKNAWSVLFKAYDISTGNLWIVVLVATVSSPYVAGKIRGII